MKRWQARGEVEDSEDDELSLDGFPSPERPRKRQKQSQDSSAESTHDQDVDTAKNGPQDHPQEEADAEDWPRPKTAITYGRKANLPKHASLVTGSTAEVSKYDVTAPKASQTSVAKSLSPEKAHEGNSTHALANNSPQRPESRNRTPSLPPNVNAVSEDQTTTQVSPVAKRDYDLSSDSEDLPDVETFLGPRARFSIPSSGLSSPLSEREISPLFVERRKSAAPLHAFRSEALATTERDTEADELSGDLVVDFDPPPSTTHARRNLRNRKPEQLNPYQVERLRYLQQCRARGVKPVRLVEREVSIEESQSAPQSSQDQEPSGFYGPSFSATQDESENERRRAFSPRYLSTNHESSGEDSRGLHRPVKRIKLGGRPTKQTRTSEMRDEVDEFSVPPSPPRTSSNASTSDELILPDSRRLSSGFIMPLGLTPAPLPTPQISSEARRIGTSQTSHASQRSDESNALRRSREPSLISVFSDSDDEDEVNSNHLRREQKRIRGVLPASWLRLDLQTRTNKRPLSRRGRDSRHIEHETGPQKGVARQVKRSGMLTPRIADFPVWSEDESDKDETLQAASSTLERSPSRRPSNARAVEPYDAVDEDSMENDFVDPMLAGGSSRPRKHKKSVRRQLRITEAFASSTAKQNDFSEERVRSRTNANNGRSRPRKTKLATMPRQQRRSHVRLSIADFSGSPSTNDSNLPSFIKFALRRARQSKNYGRHSPSHKLVRLTTADDTEEASSVLRAWRSGSIAPRTFGEQAGPPSAHSEDYQRLPLAEMPYNRRQQTFASPVRKPNVVQSARHPARTPRMRQMLLESSILPTGSEQSSRDAAQTGAHQGSRHERTRRPTNMPRLRGAQLETLEREFDEDHRAAVFERRIQCLTESVALPTRRARTSGPAIDRFLQDFDVGHNGVNQQRSSGGYDSLPHEDLSQQPTYLPHRPRKGTPRRLEIETYNFRQPGHHGGETVLDDTQNLLETDNIPSAVLQGLGPFGTKYPLDFDIQPLPARQHFLTSSFIGSGDFESTLRLTQRDLDRPNGQVRIYLNDTTYEWSSWTEEVATELSQIPKTVKEALRTLENIPTGIQEQRQAVDRNVEYLLRSAVRYLSNCLHFIDPIDRQSCVQQLEKVLVELSNVLTECSFEKSLVDNIFTKIRQYQLVLAKQALQLCQHPSISHECRKRTDDHLMHLARSLAKDGVHNRLEELEHLYGSIQLSSAGDQSDQEDLWALSSIVVLNHTLQDGPGSRSLFWEVIDVTSSLDVSNACAITTLDKVWRSIFLVLPALEIDSNGISRPGSRLFQTQENWNVVKALVERPLDLYEASSRVRGHTVNDYIRTLLARTYCLANRWGWWKCEPVLNIVYDFFAQRNLGLLRNEDGHGSPKFLEKLDGGPSFELLPGDGSFHIFLKLLASALLGMRKYDIYKDNKITGIAWRLLPNHSRTCRKDVDLQRSELDALRNHYDLLCTLYYAMPSGRRISTDTPRALVDQATSHREACRLSVRAWANMASFQMSTNEPVETLEPLIAWFNEIIKINMAQFRLAKVEAERARQEAEAEGVYIETAILESTIAKNQTEIAKTIVDAIDGLKRALASASTLQAAYALLNDSRFWSVFDIFGANKQRLLNAMLEALRLVETALDVEKRLMLSSSRSEDTTSEESQDFGDSSALQEFVATENSDQVSLPKLSSILILPLSHFVSNVFGADVSSDDSLLERLVDVWARLASVTVRNGTNTWSNYVDEYSTTSWNQMRDTVQKRKFATYFVAKVIEQSSADVEVVQRAIVAWLLSLVEREAMLKFQHTLTSMLLNHCHEEPLLHNLPFTRDCRTATFNITLHEVRQRRVALVSSILSNMRKEYDETVYWRPNRKDEVQSTYRSILRQLMQQMKTNYQELQTSGNREVAEANVQGAYVEFVQQVVSALQQHVSGICQVDRFFTDSTAFPLPADDPTYVVGRLRSYVPKLRESRTRTQLAVFIQTVSERAATDGEQHYLIQQLVAAMKDVREHGNQDSPTLRHVLLTSIVPAYIESSLSRPFAWILASPMLEACRQVLPGIMYDIQFGSEDSVRAAKEMLSCMLGSIINQADIISSDPGQLLLSHVLKMMRLFIDVFRSSLTLAAFIKRSSSHGEEVQRQLDQVHRCFEKVQACLQTPGDISGFDDEMSPAAYSPWPDTKLQADKQIRDALAANWSVSNGRYFLKRGSMSKEIVMELGEVDEERSGLIHSIAQFCEAYDTTYSPRQRRRQVEMVDDALGALVI